MLETERFQVKGKVFVVDLPLFRKIKKFPFSAALFASVIMSVRVFPSCIGPGGVPDDLGIRTN